MKILFPKQSDSAVIRTLQRVTDASISVGDTLHERLITITATENLKDKDSPSQRAIFLAFKKLHEFSTEKNLDSGYKTYTIARFVVGPYQIGCLLGKRGCTISEMQKQTGATIKILDDVEKNPKCISENDHVVDVHT
ncbi:hypothetical protein CARUB_v10003365mg [Capsella rubella]|uniref:K Homology domain-containing protein n=1 Tax=Capsella rubella TaxID=81985 RepID=R0HFU9_9BRAS|nr:hypothetical protein CARUB_v10003365mg [Capsella rubella]